MQNFKNHARFVPLYHFVILPLMLIGAIASFFNLYHSFEHPDTHFAAILITVISFSLFFAIWYLRIFSLKAQDRAIRAEQTIRHYILTGKPLDSRLTMAQIIGLRFAGDNQFVSLAEKAVNENMSQKEIKMAITDWQADNDRV